MNSEQELKKWTNKYRLYKILHGISNRNKESTLLFSACSLCPHYVAGVNPWRKRMGVNCPQNSLMMDYREFGIFINLNDNTHWADWCMEWVKHV